MDPRLRAAALGLKQKSGFVVKPIRKGIFPHAKLKQRLVGRVNATSMQKSITVNVDSFRWHNKVQKMVRKTSKVMAHDEGNQLLQCWLKNRRVTGFLCVLCIAVFVESRMCKKAIY